jgi:murein DD-endopeptidase MepM/ murein hydrolase activator NlpD
MQESGCTPWLFIRAWIGGFRLAAELWYTPRLWEDAHMRDDLASRNEPLPAPEDWGPGYHLWQSILALLAQRGPEGTTSLVRMGSHLVIILIAVGVLWLSRKELPQWDISEADSAPAQTQEAADFVPSADLNVAEQNVALVRAAVPITLIPDRPRIDIITYTVQSGDTLYGIALKHKLAAETIMFANGLENNPDLLRLGQQLTVLPVDGIFHTVKQGDTLDKIAKAYKVTSAAIVSYPWNKIDTRNPSIAVGQQLIVPGGKKDMPIKRVEIYKGPVPAGVQRGSGRFVWPTAGYVTQGFKKYHPAVDIARAIGTPVMAADSGYIVVAGWSNEGYGNYIVIDHGNGFQTLYGHLSKIFVKVGDAVGRGAVIGNMGSTGRSTGPHLHFEIRRSGVRLNPISYLP